MPGYNPRKTRNLYPPSQDKPFRLSRSKVELFLECPRCFYLDTVVGIRRPTGPPFNLNSAVDALLKNEFDFYRKRKGVHPLLAEHQLNLVPFQHPGLDRWRQNFQGIERALPGTDLVFFGAVDDIWVDPKSMETDVPTLYIVDYKATSKSEPVSLDADWQIVYKRQAEFYQWLLRGRGFEVSDTAYFVYCNADRDKPFFDHTLHFEISLISYTGSDEWIEPTLEDLHHCINQAAWPDSNPDCDFCRYRKAVADESGLFQ